MVYWHVWAVKMQSTIPFKTVGRRIPAADFITTVKFLETVVALRGTKPFIPKGVYRFKTHEEAQSWSERMMTRPSDGKSAQ